MIGDEMIAMWFWLVLLLLWLCPWWYCCLRWCCLLLLGGVGMDADGLGVVEDVQLCCSWDCCGYKPMQMCSGCCWLMMI